MKETVSQPKAALEYLYRPRLISDIKPAAYRRVLIVTADFTCLGYVDSMGQWRRNYGLETLPDVVGWLEI
jgi:hypothetical protein